MADQAVDKLNIEISANAKKAIDSIDQLIGRLNGLNSALSSSKMSGLNDLANGVSRLGSAMKWFSDSGVGKTDFNRVASGLQKISTVDVKGVLANPGSISQLASSIAGLSSLVINTTAITDLANSISKFGRKSTAEAASNIPQLTQALKDMSTELNGISMQGFDLSGLSQLASSVKTMGGAAAGRAASGNIRQLSVALKDMMQTLSNAPAVSQNIIQMTNALANLASAGGRAGTAASSVTNSIKSYSKQAKSAQVSSKGLASSIGLMYAKFFGLIHGVKQLGTSIKSAMDYLETFNFLEVVTDKMGTEYGSLFERYGYESAEAYAESFQGRLNELTEKMTGFAVGTDGILSASGVKNLGMDPAALMEYQATIASITNASGMIGETSLMASKALSMLAGDMASLRNVDLSQTMENFQSALIGQTEAVYKYGIDLTEATLQQIAYNHGVMQSVSNMSQNTKMQLRLLGILEQSKVAWGDLGRTIESPSNQLRILTQNFQNLSRMIGNLFLPIVQNVLPYINGLVIALQRLASWIGEFLGIENNISSVGGVSDAFEGIEGSASGAADAAEKLKKTILGFDNVNILNEPSSGSGSGIGGLGNVDLSGEIAASLAEYEKVWNEALENSENRMNEFADAIEESFLKVKDAAEPTLTAIKNLWNDGLSKLGNFSIGSLESFAGVLSDIGTWFLQDDAGLPKFFNITNDLLNDIDWERLNSSIQGLGDVLSPLARFVWTGLMDFYNNFLRPLATWTMNEALPRLNETLVNMSENIHWNELNSSLGKLWGALEPLAESVGRGLVNFFEDLSELGIDFLNRLPPFFEGLADAINEIDPKTMEAVGTAIGTIGASLALFKPISKAIEVFGKAVGFIQGLATGLGNFLAGGGFPIGFDKLGSDLILWVENQIRENLPEKLKGVFDDILNSIGTGFIGAFAGFSFAGPIGALVGMIGGSVIGAFVDWDRTTEIFEIAKSKFNAAFSGEGKWYEVGANIILGIGAAIVGAVSILIEPVTDVFETIVNTLLGFVGTDTSELFKVGKGFIDDVISGIGSAIGSVIDKAKEVFNSIVDTVKDILGINSPSTVFRDIGIDMIQGFINGIGEKEGELVEASSRAVKATGAASLEELGISNSEFRTKLNAGIDETSNDITERTSSIEQVASAFGTALVDGTVRGVSQNAQKMTDELGNYDKTIREKLNAAGVSGTKSFAQGLNSSSAKSEVTSSMNSILNNLYSLVNNFKLPTLKTSVTVDTSGLGGLKLSGTLGGLSGIIQAYAAGGFPDTGQLFLARESGPEMVGRIGTRTAVANNDQISSAIAAAVAPAIYNAVSAAMRSSSGGGGDTSINLVVDGERLATAVHRGDLKRSRRYNTTIQNR